ncbi:hypothetical protein DOTSEDRAFT_74484 [Dothistroma septosporum NZE10]|uniref:t-SNARE coiled-coil homology domain-containing protein n=1 Tax=Dothistroma septosporum (strain NZE10 / CBS 128990) TaxID=675120 RepID=N1PHZ9_DOTSN|nr:hypothetical protein DOTSEDRAFT_74484 [Dothistroma septosporum NZE10]
MAMSATTIKQLFLLADHLKLSLLERQRAISLNIEPTKQDASITRSLSQLRDGIDILAAQQDDLGTADDSTSELSRIRKQYGDLYAQFHGTAPPSVSTTHPNDPALADDLAHAQSRFTRSQRNRNVRFRDNPSDEEDDSANRAALFQDQQRYRDEPEAANQSNLDNVQIHTHHKQVLREQDEQLETLGQSIGRQRVLGEQMGMEIDDQNALLDDVERGVDRHSNTLSGAQKRLGHISRKAKDNWNWITITVLIIILVLLIIVLK